MIVQFKDFKIPSDEYELALRRAESIFVDMLDLDDESDMWRYDAVDVFRTVAEHYVWRDQAWIERAVALSQQLAAEAAYKAKVAEERQLLAEWNAGEPIRTAR